MAIQKGSEGTFVEEGIFDHEGKQFSSGGSFIGINKKTGKHGGVVYAYDKEGKVGTWDGSRKWYARFGRTWRSSFGDTRQSVYVLIDGVYYYGIYMKSGGDIVRIREVEPWD